MDLDKNLIKEFASIMKSPTHTNKDTKVYGTISKFEDDVPYVILDGSDLETPAEASVATKIGDRVVVQIRNHKAYISDNFTAPPDGRLGDKYFYFDDERGLIIGRIDPDTHVATGNYVLITDTDYRICNENDEVLAIYGDDDIQLGANSTNADVYFCNKKGVISYGNNTLVLEGDAATGLRSVKSNKASAQVAVAANDNRLATAMSILNASGNVEAQIGIEWESGVGNHLRLRGHDLSFNNQTVLVSNNLICVGTARVTGKLSVNKGRIFQATVNVPLGYTLAGIREITTTARVACVITSFGTNPSTNTVFANVANKSAYGNTKTITVTIEWFAFRTNSTTSGGSIDINLDGDGDDE